MLRDGLAKCRCIADLDADKPKAVNIEEASKNSIVPRISGMQRLFRIVYLPLSGGYARVQRECYGLLVFSGSSLWRNGTGARFRKRGWEMSAGGLMTVRKACTVLGHIEDGEGLCLCLSRGSVCGYFKNDSLPAGFL